MSIHLRTNQKLSTPVRGYGLSNGVSATRTTITADPNHNPYLAGASRAAQMLRAASKQLAQVAVDILLQGEQGSGKLAIAHTIAFNAGHTDMSMAVRVVDGRFPEQLRTALSGNGDAPKHSILYIQHLDALTVGQQQELVGSAGTRHTHRVRIIASVESNPTEEASKQLDPLLDRILGAVRLCVPPLRHRKEDICPTAESWRRGRLRTGGEAPTIDKAAIAALRRWDWPENVSELLAVLETAAESGNRRLDAGRLRALVPKPTKPVVGAHVLPLAEVELAYIRATVARCGNNRTRAAALLGIGRSTLIRKLQPNSGER